jgi:hypothetical protein
MSFGSDRFLGTSPLVLRERACGKLQLRAAGEVNSLR